VAQELCAAHAGFATGHGGKNFAYRFKRRVHLVDATTIQLVANCMDWAKHRRRKAAVKCHLRLEMESFLPSFVLIDTARQHEAARARELCADLQEGEIAVFDKGYVDLEHLHALHQRGVFGVTRAKDNMAYEVVEERKVEGKILRDCVIKLKHHNAKTAYPGTLRLVQAKVEVDGKEQTMEFITNHMDWSASSVADLYRCRWQIEIFFKSLKQNLQMASFLGYSANAVRWQIWMGLLVHLLMRFLKWKSQWSSHFGRLFGIVRCAMWRRWDLASCLEFYGTAGSKRRMRFNVQQAYLPGFM
jgi:DDE family transposase